MSIDLRIVNLSRMILDVLTDHSSGCKETELIEDLIMRSKENGMEFDLDSYHKAIQPLVGRNEIVIVVYSHVSDGVFREKRFIFRKY